MYAIVVFSRPLRKFHDFLTEVHILVYFNDMMLDKLLDELLSQKEIQHAINLVSGSSLSNLPYYKMNPTEQDGLRHQVNELLQNVFTREREFESCAILTLLIPTTMVIRGYV